LQILFRIAIHPSIETQAGRFVIVP